MHYIVLMVMATVVRTRSSNNNKEAEMDAKFRSMMRGINYNVNLADKTITIGGFNSFSLATQNAVISILAQYGMTMVKPGETAPVIPEAPPTPIMVHEQPTTPEPEPIVEAVVEAVPEPEPEPEPTVEVEAPADEDDSDKKSKKAKKSARK